MCKKCYGNKIIHQTNGFTGITTVKPCSKCNKNGNGCSLNLKELATKWELDEKLIQSLS